MHLAASTLTLAAALLLAGAPARAADGASLAPPPAGEGAPPPAVEGTLPPAGEGGPSPAASFAPALAPSAAPLVPATPAPAPPPVAPAAPAPAARLPVVPTQALVEKLGRADRLFLAGDHRNALFAYQDAVYLQPGYAPAHVRLGRAYLVLRYPAQAIAQAEAALAADPESAEARALLGEARAAAARADGPALSPAASEGRIYRIAPEGGGPASSSPPPAAR
jgi:hypothetical protein